jgi:hypothetical protein
MESSTSLGVHPGSPYPVVAWWDYDFYLVGNYPGRIRSFSTARAGQGPVTGAACASTGQPPQIGTRQTAAGARVTIAKARPGAMAWLNLNLANQTAYGGLPLPIDLTAIGFTGCSLHVGPAASYFRALGTSGIDRGYAAVDLPFQLTSALNGVRLAAQWIVLDPVSLDYAFTQKHELRVQ